MEQKSEVVVCPKCKGLGIAPRMKADGTPYLMMGKPVTEVCGFCNGEHAVIQRVTTEYFQITPSVIEKEKAKGGFFKKWMHK